MDDSLDVFAAHGVGGITGAILTGVFAQKSVNGLFDGLIAGNPAQVLIQAFAVLIAVVYSAGMTFVLLKLVGAITPLKAPVKEEGVGMDITQHGEEAYTSGEGAILVNTEAAMPVARPKPVGGTD
ncbi:MAG: ammonia channel protein, partial [Meiothermus sp.]|nr:ammonia channel protein [Meiothermus sp.]